MVHGIRGFSTDKADAAVCCECVRLANQAVLVSGKEVQEDDVDELLQCHTQDLTDEDLLELHAHYHTEEPATPGLVLQLSKLHGSELCDIILGHDIDHDRSFKVRQMMKQAIGVFQVLLKEKKQTKNHPLLPTRCQEAKGGGRGRSYASNGGDGGSSRE